MRKLIIDNYEITTPLLDIVYAIKSQLTNGKLHSIINKGDNIGVTCPAHKQGQESNISSYIYIGDDENIEYGYFNCFTCHTQGPFYKFVAECFDISIQESKRWLIERYGQRFQEDVIDLLPINLNSKKHTNFVSESILDSMQHYHPYMTQRKLSKSICERFKIRYDKETNSIVFPVWDDKNRLVMLTRRNVSSKIFNIPSDVEKPIYLLNAVKYKNYDYVIVTEAQIDALTAWTYGSPCVALLGTGSKTQYEILNRSEITHWVTMFDNDDAGRKATMNFNKNMRKDVLITNIFIKAPKKDINNLTEEEFKQYLIENNLEINII